MNTVEQQDGREDEQNQTAKWISVEEALLACLDADLTRTKKTIRQWCRQGHIAGQKQTTPTGERWMIERTSLLVKIKAEKEMQAQFAQVRPDVHPAAYPSEPSNHNGFGERQSAEVPPRSGHGADPSELVQPSTNPFERGGADQSEQVRTLEGKLRSVEIDKAVRDKQIEFLTKQNEEGHQNLMSQSRYIGHLETKLQALGGRADQSFLEAPISQTARDNPEQSQFEMI